MKKRNLSVLLPLMLLLCGCAHVVSSCDNIIFEDDDLSSSNSRYFLHFKNYLGNTQNLHPKVLYFEEGWNGYKFWMAYTPYPYQDTDKENPCIAVSNDGIQWKAPDKLSNPLATAPEGGYNSDTHLLYDEKTNRLECWWRIYDIKGDYDAICRRTSADGITWTPTEIVMPFDHDQHARLSPAVWIQDGEYKLVFSDGFNLFYTSAPYGMKSFNWTEPVQLPINWGGFKTWHQDVIVDDDGMWEIVVNLFPKGTKPERFDLYYVKLNPDMKHEAEPVLILERGKNTDDFDHRSIYRSSPVKVGNEYFLYYSCTNEEKRCCIALLRGPSLFDLRQLSEEEMKCK